SASKAWLRALEVTAPIARRPTRTFPAVVEELAQRFGDAPALIADGEILTFRLLDERSNRYARWATTYGVGKGDTVYLLMPNRPEYMAVWIGICRAGGAVALLNTHLVGPSLARSIDIVAPRHLIVARDLMGQFRTAMHDLSSSVVVWSHGDGDPAFPDVSEAVAELDGGPLGLDERVEVTLDDRALYIYTSGTTGLPKAAIISHFRLMNWTHWFAGMMDTGPDDRMYNCLPMYHGVGGAVATGAVLVNGGSVFIRDGFSAVAFWDDIRRHGCTIFQYIGELCRYLLDTSSGPPSATRLRLCCGNGLSADIWAAFKERFRIPQILEFYASIEGNITLFNVEERPGAIGRIPPFIAHRSRLALVKFDADRGVPLRDAEGRCIAVGTDEVGEAIGRIADAPAERAGRFEGYTAQDETESKVLRDVFEPGDAWFRSGDLMRRDAAGFYYFVDRAGDTFRWKGENISASEVAAAIASFPGVRDALVYGVSIPGADGRAGMAQIAAAGPLDVAALRAHLLKRLPRYALPVVLRIRSALELTPTFKRKAGGQEAPYDPHSCPDPLYVHVPGAGGYVALDAALYARIREGRIRL
ncbi:MAG: long-chain-acyl-CoA synthetase, partial [Xanthobacteraceae bacterium]|nr:long-chain-acyl-CoA synthetase [Xanthobacteraceae bacterium]